MGFALKVKRLQPNNNNRSEDCCSCDFESRPPIQKTSKILCPQCAPGLRPVVCCGKRLFDCLLSGGLLSELYVCESSSVLQNDPFLVQVVDEMMHHLSWSMPKRILNCSASPGPPPFQYCGRIPFSAKRAGGQNDAPPKVSRIKTPGIPSNVKMRG